MRKTLITFENFISSVTEYYIIHEIADYIVKMTCPELIKFVRHFF